MHLRVLDASTASRPAAVALLADLAAARRRRRLHCHFVSTQAAVAQGAPLLGGIPDALLPSAHVPTNVGRVVKLEVTHEPSRSGLHNFLERGAELLERPAEYAPRPP
ncbi:hypothetical protein WME98_42905 [Sorangium sp. So ce296]|uniref:hypothetical protein n=1 Tax=Sorangium sp. So ce296 TaxID=3133296 RepID=UPI003F63738F